MKWKATRNAALALALGAALAPPCGAEAAAGFEERLRRATGPAQLRELEIECAKGKQEDARRRVREVLARLPPARPGGDVRAREAARVQGDAARLAVAEFREGRTRAAAGEVRKVVAWMKTERYAPAEARERAAGIVKALFGDPAEREALEREVREVEDAERAPDKAKAAAGQFDALVQGALKKFTGPLFAAVEKCLAAGEPGHAFDLYRLILEADPDNERAHRGLGEQKAEGRWLRPFEVEQFRQGLAWSPRWGWMPLKGEGRYEAGDVFDLTTKRWGKRAELDRVHADPANPWRLPSEHFDLVSTADLELNAKLLARLEAFFLQAFRQYDLFFTGKGGGKAASLVFGVAPTKKRLVVRFYGDARQFREHAKPPTEWAAGFYSGKQGASFFHGIEEGFHVEVLQHELTHQILGDYSEGGDPPSWLAEGAAVYLECADFREGTLSLGGLRENRNVEEYRKNLRAGKPEHSFRDMVRRFGEGDSWDQGEIATNYRGAGAAVFFLMTFDGGRHRADTIQLLRDAYFGKPRPLEDYFGLSVEGLSFLMERFYKECEVP